MVTRVETWRPLAFEAFRDYRMTVAAVSGPGMQVIKRLLAGEPVTQESSGLSKIEWGSQCRFLVATRPRTTAPQRLLGVSRSESAVQAREALPEPPLSYTALTRAACP